VNRAVTQMDAVVQSNAAETEELSSTAQALTAQAGQLQILVAKFKLGEEEKKGPESAPVHAAWKPGRRAKAPEAGPVYPDSFAAGDESLVEEFHP
jgi:methyl-accepting chemotaxis protein